MIKINNDSNAPINNAKLRYYFHKDSRSYAVDAYYLAGATTTVTNINDNLAYFEIAIPSIPVGYYPDMAGFSLALHNADWSNRDKTQDYSYQATSSLAENGKIILLSDDEIIFGTGPNVQLETVPGFLRISGLKFSNGSWLEIKNVGSSAVALSDFLLVDADDSTFSLSGSLDVGEIFRICQNQTACGNANKEFTYAYSAPMPLISESQTKVVQGGETYRLKDGDGFSELRVESGSTLIIEPGEMFIDKKLQIEPNATIRFAEPGKGTVLHTNGDIIWRTYNSESASNTLYWSNVARGFKLAHHSSKQFYIEGLWAGTIYAPKAKVVMGQVNKTIYGRILGRDVVVHQNSNVYRVDFNPTDASQVAYTF